MDCDPGTKDKGIQSASPNSSDELREHSEWLRVTLLSIGDAVMTTDTQGCVTAMNPVAEELTGWEESEAVGRPLVEVFQIVNEFTRKTVPNPAERALREGIKVGLENHTVLISRNGTERPIDDSAAPIRDESGEMLGSVLVFRDVSDRRRAEETHRRLAAVVASSDDAIVSKSLDGMITSWNAGAERLYGYSPEEIIGQPFSLLIPEDRAAESQACVKRLERGERLRHFETVRRRKDGSLIDVSMSYSPMHDKAGQLIGMSVITRDISERKQAEQEIRDRERQLQLITDNAPVLIAHCTADHRFRFVNRPYAERFGMSPAEIHGLTIAEVIGEEAFAVISPYIARALKGEKVEFEAELPYQSFGTQQILCAYEPELDSLGQVVGYVAALTNITERKRVEQALQEEARFTETLYRVGQALAAKLDLKQIAETVAGEATHLTGARFGAFFYKALNDRGQPYLLQGVSGISPEELAGAAWPQDSSIFATAFSTQDVVRLADLRESSEDQNISSLTGIFSGDLKVRSFLAVPVVSRSGVVLGGLLFGHQDANMFSERHERLVRGIASQALVAIDNAQLYTQVMESEQRFRQLAENVHEVFWISDLNKQHLQFVSPAYAEVWGRTRQSLYDDPQTFFQAIHPQDQERVQKESLDRQKEGKSTDLEFRVVRPDGSIRWVRDRSFPIRSESGTVYRMVGVAEDITKQKLAEQNARFLADASASLSAVVDFESTLQKIAGLAVPDFADWCAVDLLEPQNQLRRIVVAQLPAEPLVAASAWNHQIITPNPDASVGPGRVLRSLEPELVSEVSTAMLAEIAADETQRHQLEAMNIRSMICVPIRSRNQLLGILTFASAQSGRQYDDVDLALADELSLRAAAAMENARLYADLREADRRKDEFLAMLAHELRNPLAPIRTGLEILALDEQVSSDTVQLMQQQVGHLVRLVDDLLDVSRIVRGRVELRHEIVDLSTLVERSVETIRRRIEDRAQHLSIELPSRTVWVNADPIRLVQVLENLLNNASKYTDDGGHIEITCREQGENVVISFRDDGIGLEPELLPNVFELFTQSARTLDRSQGGLGIGLTLVRNLVELHGGEVTAHSEGPGRGSCFVVTLPISRSQVPLPLPEPEIEHSLVGRRILVVDDNIGAATMISLLAQRLGPHEIEMAHDGPAALETARTFRPDVILLDIGLPHMDGLTVAWTLRQSSDFDDALLVALTGYGQEEDRRKSQQAGFDEHYVKPIGIENLRRILSHPKLNRG